MSSSSQEKEQKNKRKKNHILFASIPSPFYEMEHWDSVPEIPEEIQTILARDAKQKEELQESSEKAFEKSEKTLKDFLSSCDEEFAKEDNEQEEDNNHLAAFFKDLSSIQISLQEIEKEEEPEEEEEKEEENNKEKRAIISTPLTRANVLLQIIDNIVLVVPVAFELAPFFVPVLSSMINPLFAFWKNKKDQKERKEKKNDDDEEEEEQKLKKCRVSNNNNNSMGEDEKLYVASRRWMRDIKAKECSQLQRWRQVMDQIACNASASSLQKNFHTSEFGEAWSTMMVYLLDIEEDMQKHRRIIYEQEEKQKVLEKEKKKKKKEEEGEEKEEEEEEEEKKEALVMTAESNILLDFEEFCGPAFMLLERVFADGSQFSQEEEQNKKEEQKKVPAFVSCCTPKFVQNIILIAKRLASFKISEFSESVRDSHILSLEYLIQYWHDLCCRKFTEGSDFPSLLVLKQNPEFSSVAISSIKTQLENMSEYQTGKVSWAEDVALRTKLQRSMERLELDLLKKKFSKNKVYLRSISDETMRSDGWSHVRQLPLEIETALSQDDETDGGQDSQILAFLPSHSPGLLKELAEIRPSNTSSQVLLCKSINRLLYPANQAGNMSHFRQFHDCLFASSKFVVDDFSLGHFLDATITASVSSAGQMELCTPQYGSCLSRLCSLPCAQTAFRTETIMTVTSVLLDGNAGAVASIKNVKKALIGSLMTKELVYSLISLVKFAVDDSCARWIISCFYIAIAEPSTLQLFARHPGFPAAVEHVSSLLEERDATADCRVAVSALLGVSVSNQVILQRVRRLLLRRDPDRLPEIDEMEKMCPEKLNHEFLTVTLVGDYGEEDERDIQEVLRINRLLESWHELQPLL